MRTKVLAANWKMNKTPDETRSFFRDFLPLVTGHDRDEIAVCPPFVDLCAAVEAARGSNVAIGCSTAAFKARREWLTDTCRRHGGGNYLPSRVTAAELSARSPAYAPSSIILF
jgi:hypothetical protein